MAALDPDVPFEDVAERTLGDDLGADLREAKDSTTEVAVWLAIASVVGTLAVLPFSAFLVVQMKGSSGLLEDANALPGESGLLLVLGISAAVEFVCSGISIYLGLLLARRAGLGVPELQAALAGDRAAGRAVRNSLPLATGLGLGLGVLLVLFALLHPSLSKSESSFAMPPLWEGFLAAIGAGIREEVWLRFGVMTLLAWCGALAMRQERASAEVIWLANFLSALAFAAIHIPQTAAIIGLSAPVLLFVFLGNGLPGMVFGWLYWRRGLAAAMVAHFWLDIVLKVILPALVG